MKTVLKPYMGFSEQGINEGACLIFAHSVKEAKKYAYQVLIGWAMIDEWIDVRVNLMRNKDFLYDEGNEDKLRKNIPHVVESPGVCVECETWGSETDDDGICRNCHEL